MMAPPEGMSEEMAWILEGEWNEALANMGLAASLGWLMSIYW